VGIIATNAAEVVQRSRADVAGSITDLQEARSIELLTGATGLVWVNVDGVCLLRIKRVETVIVDTSNALSTDKVV
jgi:hypothetical protein